MVDSLMIKKKWRRIAILVATVFISVHLYLTLSTAHDYKTLQNINQVDVFTMRKIATENPHILSNITLKVPRYPAATNSDIVFKLDSDSLNVAKRRNPKTIVSTRNYEIYRNYKSMSKAYNNTIPKSSEKFPTNNVSLIMIVAYIRSGSSLTGDILQQDPNSFYVYEPLHFTEKMGKKIMYSLLLNGSRVNIEKKNFFSRASQIINSYYNCDFYDGLDYGTLVHGFQTFGNKTNKFINCFTTIKAKNKVSKRNAAKTCAKELEKACKNSKFRTIKTIRMPMSELNLYLKQHENLKIIHLVRDPRAQIFSIDKLAKTTKYNRGFATHKCKYMAHDYYYAEVYRRRYPNRILRLYYEDLATDPINISRKLYEFTGMDFTSKVKDYIFGITSKGGVDSCAICSKRGNSSAHVQKWRQHMAFEEVQVVDDVCATVYEQYGFLPALSKQKLRNLNIPLRNKFT